MGSLGLGWHVCSGSCAAESEDPPVSSGHRDRSDSGRVELVHGYHLGVVGGCLWRAPRKQDISRNMKDDFYAFFWPQAVSDRRGAINAIAAGVVAGSLLTGALGCACAVCALRGVASSQTVDILLLTTIALAFVTVGIWKHVLSAAVSGLLIGVAFMTWLIRHEQIAAAIVLVVPFVGGFLTATRGVLVLRRVTPPRRLRMGEPN